MGGRGFLVGNEVFCLFVVVRLARGGEERVSHLSVFVHWLIGSFVRSFRV